jgi:hypothetical protein
VDLVDATFGNIQVGDDLAGALVLSSKWVARAESEGREGSEGNEGSEGSEGSEGGGMWVLQLSLKPLLLDKQGTAEHPASMDSVTPGQLLFGYCASVTRIGVFVRYVKSLLYMLVVLVT